MSDEKPKLESAERIDNGVVIDFADGESGFYSAELLYSVLPEAEPLDDDNDDRST